MSTDSCCSINLKISWAIPVSYTHLDVYKRQERSCLRKGQSRTKVYYCHPYSSYERGTNENINGMIRRWFPKGTDFGKVTAKAIKAVEDWINTYPRGILGFFTADDIFLPWVASLA